MAEISIQELNRLATSELEKTISEVDAAYHGKIEEIADTVKKSGNIRIILLAGPSGSGKTTTANFLSDAIKRRGIKSFVISLDDFYRSSTDPAYPTNERGERDYECVGALDIDLIINTLEKIADGEEFSLPKYDFKVGACVKNTPYEPLGDGCVVIEGLHAMNPRIYDPLPHDKVLKMFISVSTNVTDNGEIILSGKKLRFVRRLVRDSIYRGADAYRTLGMWQGVLDGEIKYLYPFRDLADVTMNTFHAYELSLMKPFVAKLLTDEVAKSSEYAAIVKATYDKSVAIDQSHVSDYSLLREFIPGGVYESLY
ncbi:MAG: hypothetical protein IJY65_02300 [Clostridia bacterium]|nr:hypothetical protein [Clostridia bacterium]